MPADACHSSLFWFLRVDIICYSVNLTIVFIVEILFLLRPRVHTLNRAARYHGIQSDRSLHKSFFDYLLAYAFNVYIIFFAALLNAT